MNEFLKESRLVCQNQDCDNENLMVLYSLDNTGIVGEREIIDEYTDRVVDIEEVWHNDFEEVVYCPDCKKVTVYIAYYDMDMGNTACGGLEDMEDGLKYLIDYYFKCKEDKELEKHFNFELYEELCKKYNVEIVKEEIVAEELNEFDKLIGEDEYEYKTGLDPAGFQAISDEDIPF